MKDFLVLQKETLLRSKTLLDLLKKSDWIRIVIIVMMLTRIIINIMTINDMSKKPDGEKIYARHSMLFFFHK